MATKQKMTFSGHEVRLFPSVHINNDREAELRATASLLSMICAVSEFGKKIVRRAGGSGGKLFCFTEMPFLLQQGDGSQPEKIRPDGLIKAVWGKKRWIALLEVKIGNNALDQEQIDKYHRLARQEGYDTVITISNQPAKENGKPPVKLNGHLIKKIPVVHYSWDRLLSEAQGLSRRKAVSDPDQKWMLDEWIRYVDDEKSKIIVKPDLGPNWSSVLKAARTNTLDQSCDTLQDVVKCWIGYLRKAALQLQAKLGVDVQIRLSRKEKNNNDIYIKNLIAKARANGTLSGIFHIPCAIGDIQVEVFLHSRSVRYGVKVAAPTKGRQKTRLNWLVKQLRNVNFPCNLLVTAAWSAHGLLTSASANELVDNPDVLCVDQKGVPLPRDINPKHFLLQCTKKLHNSRGRSNAPVLEGISKGLEDFYHCVIEDLVPFVPPAPRLITEEVRREDHNEDPQENSNGVISSDINTKGKVRSERFFEDYPDRQFAIIRKTEKDEDS